MLILHVVAAGISLLDHLEQPWLATDDLPGSPIEVREALQWAVSGPRQELDWERLKLAGLPQTQAGADPDMAAEWTSITAITAQPRYASAQGHAYVFLATDTNDGLRAATLVAARYQRTSTRYLHEPLATRWPPVEPGDVYVCRIPALNLGKRRRRAPRGDHSARSDGWSPTLLGRPVTATGK